MAGGFTSSRRIVAHSLNLPAPRVLSPRANSAHLYHSCVRILGLSGMLNLPIQPRRVASAPRARDERGNNIDRVSQHATGHIPFCLLPPPYPVSYLRWRPCTSLPHFSQVLTMSNRTMVRRKKLMADKGLYPETIVRVEMSFRTWS